MRVRKVRGEIGWGGGGRGGEGRQGMFVCRKSGGGVSEMGGRKEGGSDWRAQGGGRMLGGRGGGRQ